MKKLYKHILLLIVVDLSVVEEWEKVTFENKVSYNKNIFIK